MESRRCEGVARVLWSTVLVVTLGCAGAARGPADPVASNAAIEVRAAAQLLDDWVARVALLPLGVAARQHVIGASPDPKVIEYLAALLAEMPAEDVYGVYLAFEHKRWSEPLAMPWVDRRSWPKATVVAYDYHEPKWEWYAGPKRTGKPYVTEPYFDDGGSNITMVSATRPVRDERGAFIGVAGADLSLQDIRKRLHTSAGELYLVSRAGRIIAHPDTRLMLRKDYDGEELKNLPGGAEVAAQPSGDARITDAGQSRRLVWTTAPLTGWKIVLSVP